MEQEERTSRLCVEVVLDEKKCPRKILWKADEGTIEASETRAMKFCVWDDKKQDTLQLDLWTSQMSVRDMKRFYVDILGGMSQSLLSATSDAEMSSEIKSLCERLLSRLREDTVSK